MKTVPVVKIPLEFCSGSYSAKWTHQVASANDQETVKGPFGLRVKLPPVYHTQWRLHIVPFNADQQAGKL